MVLIVKVPDYDVIVIGAGFSGLGMLHRLNDLGFNACILERGDDIGGTWFWNRYPGARCDLQSVEYSYSYPEIQDDWEWTELFAAQPEIESYIHFVADRWKLHDQIHLSTTVKSASWDGEYWTIGTDSRGSLITRTVVAATGGLSEPLVPQIDGIERFNGDVLISGTYPKEGYDYTAKNVAIFGTGSSGVQMVPHLAQQADNLYIVQRSAAYARPAHNRQLEPGEMDQLKKEYPELRAAQLASPIGTVRLGALTAPPPLATGPQPDRRLLESTPDERAEVLRELGWAGPWAWADLLTDPEANLVANGMFRDLIASVVEDDGLVDSLLPQYPIGCKRQVLGIDYFETFNRENVHLIDLKKTTVSVGEGGDSLIAEADSIHIDTIVLATGFDAMTGALSKIDIRGLGGTSLADTWASLGPVNYLGLQISGFPNFFMMTGPGSPSTNVNFLPAIEQHIDVIGSMLVYLRDSGFSSMEARSEAQSSWIETVAAAAHGSVRTWSTCNSWYLGSNVPGKPRVYLPYMGGMLKYRAICDLEAASDYPHFVFK
ncbi:flavin-containing monooxygenase [Jatrophihabitans sp. DSM 45814]